MGRKKDAIPVIWDYSVCMWTNLLSLVACELDMAEERYADSTRTVRLENWQKVGELEIRRPQ